MVRSACEDLGVRWRAVDVDTDAALRARYTDHVPVTFVDQRQFGYWFVDDDALRAALAVPSLWDTPADWIPSLADQP